MVLRRACSSELTALALTVLAATAAAASTAGCKAIPPPEAGSGGSGTGSGGSSGTGGVDGGVVPMDAPSQEKFSAGDMSMALDGACSAVTSSAKLVPLDLYVIMDSSKSMLDTDANNVDKWTDLRNAMSSFFNDANSAGFSVALKYFPDEQDGVPETCANDPDCGGKGPCEQRKACVAQGKFSMSPSQLCKGNADCTDEPGSVCVPVQHCKMGEGCMARNCVADMGASCPSDCQAFTGYCQGRDTCDVDTYATPSVAFGELPGAANDLIASLKNHAPSGYTPTGPALTGALKAARARAVDKPDHKVAVVLVTDGLPGGFIPGMPPPGCTPTDPAEVASLLSGKMGLAGTPSVPTFVIGIFGPCDLQQGNTQMPKEKLTSWAAAGGTMSAVLVDTSLDVTKQIQDAFKSVQSKVISCQYAIPKDVVGGIDFKEVNVVFSSDAMMTSLPVHYVQKKDNCDPNTGGWYYDADPDPPTNGNPTQIIACDKSCNDFKAAMGAKVEIALGCARVN